MLPKGRAWVEPEPPYKPPAPGARILLENIAGVKADAVRRATIVGLVPGDGVLLTWCDASDFGDCHGGDASKFDGAVRVSFGADGFVLGYIPNTRKRAVAGVLGISAENRTARGWVFANSRLEGTCAGMPPDDRRRAVANAMRFGTMPDAIYLVIAAWAVPEQPDDRTTVRVGLGGAAETRNALVWAADAALVSSDDADVAATALRRRVLGMKDRRGLEVRSVGSLQGVVDCRRDRLRLWQRQARRGATTPVWAPCTSVEAKEALRSDHTALSRLFPDEFCYVA
jgi:hypothetical protein